MGASIEELLSSDGSMGMSVGHFTNQYLMSEVQPTLGGAMPSQVGS